jgi:hypothetical protein
MNLLGQDQHLYEFETHVCGERNHFKSYGITLILVCLNYLVLQNDIKNFRTSNTLT